MQVQKARDVIVMGASTGGVVVVREASLICFRLICWPSEAVHLGIPERIAQSDARENLTHFFRLRTPGIRLQSGAIPGLRQSPQLIHAYDWPLNVSLRLAPLLHPYFRPEEEHLASGEYNIVPPVGRGNNAVKHPVRTCGTFEPHFQAQGLHRLLTA